MPLVSSNSLEEKSKITESPAEAKDIYLVLHPFIKRLICQYLLCRIRMGSVLSRLSTLVRSP